MSDRPKALTPSLNLLRIFILCVASYIVAEMPMQAATISHVSAEEDDASVTFVLTPGIPPGVIDAVHSSSNLTTWSPVERVALSGDEAELRIVLSSPGETAFLRIETLDETFFAAEGFVLVPSGTFTAGISAEEIYPDEITAFEAPRERTVDTPFYMAATEIRWGKWNEVRDWARVRGYPDIAAGTCGSGEVNNPDWPVANISWADAVKWCNARSEMDGLEPVYYLSRDFDESNVYRSEKQYWEQIAFRSDAVGYRLPTQVEWEWACRAGSATATPAGNITEWDDAVVDPALNGVAWYVANSGRQTHPVASKKANAFGLYDMLGNVSELCEERFTRRFEYYMSGDSIGVDFTRLGFGGSRGVSRGGSFESPASQTRSGGTRQYRFNRPNNPVTSDGLRPVINVPRPMAIPGEDRVVFTEEGSVQTIQLDASRSFTGDGATLVAWTWSWVGGHAEGSQVSIDLPKGKTEITLTVEDNRGMRDSATLGITVLDPMVRIDPGTFMMGAAPHDEVGSETYHEVTLTRAFDVGTTEVTWEEWTHVRDWAITRGYTDLPVGRPGSGAYENPLLPVGAISWRDAVQWCNAKSEMEGRAPYYRYTTGWTDDIFRRRVSWSREDIYTTGSTGYRLPTEAEWEYAARAGSTNAWFTGPSFSDATIRAGWNDQNSHRSPHIVAQGEANAWGLCDVHGNLFERVWDDYMVLSTNSVNDPGGRIAVSDTGVLRGGSILSNAYNFRVPRRVSTSQNNRYVDVGFRIAANASAQPVCNAPTQQEFMSEPYGFINGLGRAIVYLSETRFRSDAYEPAEFGNWTYKVEPDCDRVVIEFTSDSEGNDRNRYLERHTLTFTTPLTGEHNQQVFEAGQLVNDNTTNF